VPPNQALQPSERKRWQIGAALAELPDVLLLDEPENHLDAAARDLLVASLARFRGVGVVISHDRALLDALTRSTIRVAADAVTLSPRVPRGAAPGDARRGLRSAVHDDAVASGGGEGDPGVSRRRLVIASRLGRGTP
jgi:energy-coupling factor transporter ATP-binding protein EcfA2